MNTNDILFETGPYGEVFPFPLTGGLEPDDALEQLSQDSAAMGSPIKMPTRGKSLDGMYSLAMLYVHQLRLRQALAGELEELPEAVALRQIVMEQHQLMSLRPLTMEYQDYGFAPVLHFTEDGKWVVGQEDVGRLEVTFEEEDPCQAMARAQALFKTWAESDDERWLDATKKVTNEHARSLFHEYWAYRLRQNEEWDRGDGFGLRLLGRHSHYMLETPRGPRVISMSAVKAAHLCDALARHASVAPVFPASTEVMEWLTELGVPFPSYTTDDASHWTIGNVQVEMQREQGRIVMMGGDQQAYVLLPRRQKRQRELVLVSAGQKGKKSSKKERPIARTAWEEPFQDWMRDAGRMVLTMWFAHTAKMVNLENVGA